MELTEEELSSSVYMTLNAKPQSKSALALMDELEALIRKHRPRLSYKSKDALHSIVADLLKAAQVEGRYSFRSLAAGSFSHERVGYTPFRSVIAAMEAARLLKLIRGGSEVGSRLWSSRLKATNKLLLLARKHGIDRADWSSHFEPLPRPKGIPNPLVLRKNSTFWKGQKRVGASVPIDLSRSPARELAERVNSLNAFLAGVAIEPADSHYAFQRVFNQADEPGFNWDKGGRLYSLGVSYQQTKAADRKKMFLNGLPVVEVDIRASHLTVLHALLKLPFDPKTDPYQVPGLPRDVVKAWVTMTLGYDRFQTRWSNESKAAYLESTGRNLSKDYPVKAVREKVLTALPMLKDWPTCRTRWGDLQYVESCIMIDAMETLAKADIPTLPVHDSLIVPAKDESVARSAITNAFKRVLGVEPGLSTK